MIPRQVVARDHFLVVLFHYWSSSKTRLSAQRLVHESGEPAVFVGNFTMLDAGEGFPHLHGDGT